MSQRRPAKNSLRVDETLGLEYFQRLLQDFNRKSQGFWLSVCCENFEWIALLVGDDVPDHNLLCVRVGSRVGLVR